jgi:hypothetical protein
VLRRFFAGLAVVVVVIAGIASYFVPMPAVIPLRILAGLVGLAVALFNFWRAVMEKD